jgi:DNA-binding PadR family transcriptional regulator
MNVKTLCLGILTFHEASGYEIKKMIEEGMFSHFIDASYGSIYPALTQMLGDNLVTVRAEEQTGRPDKKVYAITSEGRRALAEALQVMPAHDKFKSEFLFQMLLGAEIDADHITQVYDAQLSMLTEELARVEACSEHANDHVGTRFVNGYGQAVLAAAVDYMRRVRDETLEGAARREAAE